MPNHIPTPAPTPAYDADIIILSLDRLADTLAAIASALAQTGLSRHVIIVDQGSRPDNLRQIQASCAAHPDITMVALDKNLGVAGGRNHATSLGQGRVIIGLDNDALFDTQTSAATAVAALDADPTLAAIGLRIVTDADGSDDLSSWGYPQGNRT